MQTMVGYWWTRLVDMFETFDRYVVYFGWTCWIKKRVDLLITETTDRGQLTLFVSSSEINMSSYSNFWCLLNLPDSFKRYSQTEKDFVLKSRPRLIQPRAKPSLSDHRIRFDLETVDTCGVSNTCTSLFFYILRRVVSKPETLASRSQDWMHSILCARHLIY